jgi:MFS family permease
MSPFKRIFPVFLIVFFGYVGYSLIITIFTPMLLHGQGRLLPDDASTELRILALGFMLAYYPFGQFLSSPVLGALSDRFGRRPILIFSLIITTIVYLVIALGIWLDSYAIVSLALLIAGLSEGNTTISQSVIADIIPKEQRGLFFGYSYFVAALAFILGPLIGGKLANPDFISWFSYKTPFLFVATFRTSSGKDLLPRSLYQFEKYFHHAPRTPLFPGEFFHLSRDIRVFSGVSYLRRGKIRFECNHAGDFHRLVIGTFFSRESFSYRTSIQKMAPPSISRYFGFLDRNFFTPRDFAQTRMDFMDYPFVDRLWDCPLPSFLFGHAIAYR